VSAVRLELSEIGVVLDERAVLADVELTVGPGERHVLVGPNGSGKTTLLRTVYRALRPAAGVVRLDGADVWELTVRQAARRRAVLAQEPPGARAEIGGGFTVTEVVLTGRTPHLGTFDRESAHDRALAGDALRQVGMSGAADRTLGTLSGGERQKVLLARALAQQAPLLILDEPTNHLDVRAQLELLDLVGGLGITVLAALHDLDQAAWFADRVSVLRAGRLVAGGPAVEVLTAQRIQQVFGVRAHVGPHPLTGRPHVALAPLPDPCER
jgi:iron complex transport system ATP-binding protein